MDHSILLPNGDLLHIQRYKINGVIARVIAPQELASRFKTLNGNVSRLHCALEETDVIVYMYMSVCHQTKVHKCKQLPDPVPYQVFLQLARQLLQPRDRQAAHPPRHRSEARPRHGKAVSPRSAAISCACGAGIQRQFHDHRSGR